MPATPHYWLKNTPKEVLAAPFADQAARQQLLNAATSNKDDQLAITIWLTNIEQIHQFVRHVPDLAWELMDYATEPLTLIYAEAKPLIRGENPPEEIAVRLITQPELLKLLTTRQPWISVCTQDVSPDFPFEGWVTKKIELKVKGKPPQKLKTMRVFDNGRFNILP